MEISGLVISLAEDVTGAEAAIGTLAEAGPFTIGERFGHCVSVVMETDEGAEARAWHKWIEQLDGVVRVDVAFASYDKEQRQ